MKNDVFNFNRFGRYLVTDIKNAVSRYGISLLVLASFSFAGYLLAGLFSSVVGLKWYSMPVDGRLTLFVFITFIVLTMGPSKIYGFITDKKEGAQFLMLPASTLEKTISMIIVACILMPLAYFAIYFSLDELLCLFDPNCGNPIIMAIHEFRYDSVARVVNNMQSDELSGWTRPAFMLDDIAQTAMVFLLGALVFKTSKTAKTIGCMILLTLVLSMIIIPIITCGGFDVLKAAITNDVTPYELISQYPVLVWFFKHPLLADFLIDTLWIVALFVLILFRVKKIKH